MWQNPHKTLGYKKNMVYKIPPGGGKPYPASGLYKLVSKVNVVFKIFYSDNLHLDRYIMSICLGSDSKL